jgi:biotin-(acetyl-CoA carboxylase) ligase
MAQNFTQNNLFFPPGFEVITLRESKDAHKTACETAGEKGAGTLFITRRFDIAEFALILEPDEPLILARKALFVGMNALADALSNVAPPEKPVTLQYPDSILLDSGLIGGGRLAWSDGQETLAPNWMVFSAQIRLSIVGVKELGLAALATSLESEGGEELDTMSFVSSFARHFMNGAHLYIEEGFKGSAQTYLARLPRIKERRGIDLNGDLLVSGGEKIDFLKALEPVQWLDKTSGAPKL